MNIYKNYKIAPDEKIKNKKKSKKICYNGKPLKNAKIESNKRIERRKERNKDEKFYDLRKVSVLRSVLYVCESI